MSRVSVLLSVRNGADTLPRALDSILAQTFTDWRAVIVNDGSTDDTLSVLETYQKQDARFGVLDRPAEGLVAALNAGLSHCTGEFIARMDADDYCYPERLARQLAFLYEHPEIDIVSSRVRHVGDPIAQQGYAEHVAWLNTLISHKQHSQQRFVDQPLANPSATLRQAVFNSVGSYRSGDFPEDYEFWLRCLHAGHQMAKLPEVLLDWYDLPTRATRNLGMYREEAFFKTKAEYWSLWAQEHLNDQTEVWIWGVSKEIRRKTSILQDYGWDPTGYIDVTQKRQFNGKPVIHFTDLSKISHPRHVLVYVANREGKQRIQKYLEQLRWRPGLDFHFMA
ncbi:MAG TPA: glycosyl transferase family 2 [Cytophagales bacterium]|nr:glycosyl transferase family 2 [Cytophagales bacterium]HAA21035.1 glycosyl transferase family 2 [Cytophagales bacterium]HAP61516.1 glycosyl transferase family 2 [Cytophagales bacterium]